jgi:exosortase
MHLSNTDVPWAPLAQNARFVALCGVLLATMLLYLPSWMSLLRLWNAFGSRFYTHGDLIVALAAIALFRRRQLLARAPLAPRPWGAVLLLVLSVIWLAARLSSIQVVHQACMPLILLCVTYTLFGPQTAGLCRFPILYLYAAVPVWEWIKAPLQALTVTVVELCLPVLGIPAYINGNLVEIPAGTFEIQSGCAGSAYLIVAVGIAAYYGDMLQSSLPSRAILVALAAALAIVGNWVRVLVIIAAGQLTGMQSYLVRVSHDGFGWAVFAVAMAAFVYLAAKMTRRASEQPAPEEAGGQDLHCDHRSVMPKATLATMLAFASLAVAPALSLIAMHRVVDHTPQVVLQRGSNGWSGPVAYHGTWQPIFAGADAQGLGVYQSQEGDVALYIAEYVLQSDRGKLHGEGNTPLGDAPHRVENERSIDHEGGSLREFQLTDLDRSRWLMWVAYDVGGRMSASLLSAQLWYALESLATAPRSRAIALQIRCLPDCSAARALASRFLTANPWVVATTPSAPRLEERQP